MRAFLPSNIIAFVVTQPMFKQLCELDEKSFLFKPFLESIKELRKDE